MFNLNNKNQMGMNKNINNMMNTFMNNNYKGQNINSNQFIQNKNFAGINLNNNFRFNQLGNQSNNINNQFNNQMNTSFSNYRFNSNNEFLSGANKGMIENSKTNGLTSQNINNNFSKIFLNSLIY